MGVCAGGDVFGEGDTFEGEDHTGAAIDDDGLGFGDVEADFSVLCVWVCVWVCGCMGVCMCECFKGGVNKCVFIYMRGVGTEKSCGST